MLLKCLITAVAANTDSSEEVVATQFWMRIGVDLLRGACRSFHRRLAGKGGVGDVGVGDPFGGSLGLAIAGGC